MSKPLVFDKIEWFDVTKFIGEPTVIADVWLNEIEMRIPSQGLDFVRETFLRAGLRAYRGKFGDSVTAKDIYKISGYSKSTFHRMFDGFGVYQLKIYHFLGNMAAEIYGEYLGLRERTPEELCRFTRDCIYSSHLAVPKFVVSEVYRANSPISPERFHPFVNRTAEVIHDYTRLNQHLGYRTFSQDGLTEVIRTLDYDILFSKINDTGTFPNAEQAYRLERMLLAYIT